jgi:acetyl esterase/lipase
MGRETAAPEGEPVVKTKPYSVLLAALGVIGAQAAATAQAVPAETHLDVPYAQIDGADPGLLSLDIYVPHDAEDRPVVVYVHGGGWQRGDKARVAALAPACLDEGYVFVSTNYRLAPEAPFPAWPEDVAAAIAWTHRNIAEYGGDPGRLWIMGHSAGAHLVALVATDERYLEEHGLTLGDLAAVVPLDTQGLDLTALAADGGGELPRAYRVPFTDDPDVWTEASPATYVEEGKDIPPTLLCYSGGSVPGRVHTGRQAFNEAYAETLRAAGVRAEVVGAPDRTHGQIVREFAVAEDPVAPAVFAFIADVLAAAQN